MSWNTKYTPPLPIVPFGKVTEAKELSSRFSEEIVLGKPNHEAIPMQSLKELLTWFQLGVFRSDQTLEKNSADAQKYGDYMLSKLLEQYNHLSGPEPIWQKKRDFINQLEIILNQDLWILAYAMARLPDRFDLERIFRVLCNAAEYYLRAKADTIYHPRNLVLQQEYLTTLVNLSRLFCGTSFSVTCSDSEHPHRLFAFIHMVQQGWNPPLELVPKLVEFQMTNPF